MSINRAMQHWKPNEGRQAQRPPFSRYTPAGGLPQDPPLVAESSIVTQTASAFDLSTLAAAKADSALIGDDERHFALIEQSLARSVDELSARLEAARRSRAGVGSEAVERDMEIRRLSSRLLALSRYGLDLCLGRILITGEPEPVYIGRLGLTDDEGDRLLVDWRSPAAEPFFAATFAHPIGLTSRRRYRWSRGRITDYWDEVFTADGADGNAALDEQSAFIASLGSSRSPKMRDVLATIQGDQDAIIRADARGALVVDGGPGTGKTVVALHRAAYLLYADPRISRQRGGVLFIGPSAAYLSYVADILPNLGEDGVQTCTLRNLLPEGATAVAETNQDAARLKSSSALTQALESAVARYERPPARGMTVETEWDDIWLDPADWAEAFASVEPGAPHNEAREQVWDQLLGILADLRDDDEVPAESVRQSLVQNRELRAAFQRAWPLLDPVGVVADLLSVPAYLQECAPWLSAEERAALLRSDGRAWTTSDLPLLDAARFRIGDPDEARRDRQRDAAIAQERERISQVVDDLVAAEDDHEGLSWMLRQESMQEALVDPSALPTFDPDLLAGPFAHVVVDEAQELTDAEWQMLLRRCPSRSFTIVGDRAQARHGFVESWQERLNRVGLGSVTVASLTINYRTPEEVMAEAEPVIRAAIPDANVPTSVRSSGLPVIRGRSSELESILDAWLAAHDAGIACVIGDPDFVATPRVASLTPESAKGLEFDLVVVVDPDRFGTGIEGAVDRYVAMTRATQQLVILDGEDTFNR
jgi:hypothetical protein